MGSVFSLLFVAILSGPSAQAALSFDTSPAITFFRNKNSLFPSGQLSRGTLESQLLKLEEEAAYKVRWDHKSFMVRAENVIRDIHVAGIVDLKSSQSLYSTPSITSPEMGKLQANSSVTILEIQDFWALVSRDGKNRAGWIPLEQLKTRHNDVGVYLNFVATALREKAHPQAHRVTLIPERSRFIPLGFENGHLKISYRGQIGFADVTHFLSRADFATLAYHPKKNWLAVRYRNNHNLITQKGETLALSEVSGFVTSPLRGIIAKPEPSQEKTPPARARVEIEETRAFTWAQSRVKDHGEIWWKKSDLTELATAALVKDKDSLSTEDLLKKDIHSLAFASKDSLRGLVSSHGVYRTEDGQTWKRIPQFGAQNLPVSIHPNGTWFVGSFKSADYGKTFAPFIRWDQIAQAIDSSTKRNHRFLKLLTIEPLPDSRVQIIVDTGSERVQLKSLIGDFSWSVVR